MKHFRIADLFSGIGGIRLGFERAFENDIETVFASEIDVKAQTTYRANFADNFEIAGDITKIPSSAIPAFDICLAGFPCQAFSIAGKRKGFDDDLARGTLFKEVIRICEYHKPKVIFCENVKGLLCHDKGITFNIIKNSFENIGYTVKYSVLNSKNFGVPQSRERVYIVCFRNDIDSSYFLFPEKYDKTCCIRDILENAPIPSRYYISDVYLENLRKHKERQHALGHGYGYEIRNLNNVAKTLVCGGMGVERNLIVDAREHSMIPTTHIRGKINSENIRKLTPREWARLQGFPDTFRLPLADTNIYRQLGNSVTVNVIEAIARQIRKII